MAWVASGTMTNGLAGPEDRHMKTVNASRKSRLGSVAKIGAAIGAVAVGAVAVGAFAIGVFAIGRLAIRRLAIESAKLKSLEIEDLTVKRLHASEVTVSDSIKLPKEKQDPRFPS